MKTEQELRQRLKTLQSMLDGDGIYEDEVERLLGPDCFGCTPYSEEVRKKIRGGIYYEIEILEEVLGENQMYPGYAYHDFKRVEQEIFDSISI